MIAYGSRAVLAAELAQGDGLPEWIDPSLGIHFLGR